MNIPFLSWVFLMGRCHFCKEKISIQYPTVELIIGSLFCAIYYKYGWSITTLEFCFFGWGLVTASVIDLHHMILPDVFTLSGIVLGLVGAFLSPERSFSDAFFGFAIGFGALYAMAYLFYIFKGVEGMGGGDIKLIGWIGAYLGVAGVPFTIFVSSLLGSLIGVVYLAIKKKDMKTTGIPFGPFLSAAALIYIYFRPINFLFF